MRQDRMAEYPTVTKRRGEVSLPVTVKPALSLRAGKPRKVRPYAGRPTSLAFILLKLSKHS